MSTKHIYFQEGHAIDYVKGLQKEYGGDIEDNKIYIERGRLRIYVEAILIFNGFELLLLNVDSPEDIVFHRTPDNNPNFIHLNVIKEGIYQQKFEQEMTQMQYGTQNGVFVYDALFPITVEIPANSNLKIIGFKFDLSIRNSIMSNALNSITTLFKEQAGVAFHTNLSQESERLLKDILHFQTLDKNRRALIVSRAIESFTILATNLEKLNSQDELHGLHIEDYSRLQSIKQKLSTSFEERATVEKLAETYGVSVSKLKRDFKTLFNCSITHYYTNAKIDEAYRRLKSGKFTVSEVGYDLGYSNLSKFSEMFKKLKGISPRDVVKIN
ncbi:helix-turn-helix transcriptional regulator [Carboxylicivirga sediminis]|uniref:Helix-turn-helix transcriptional regulator n=1 Tax=Carboxylicivirga sediminis TaxID=2006564 RepID=A0A941F1U8_9BACT|nr:helix-turn-helix domain-containing protein [Carboxylicivirga sediminis]MBR8535221.1 helix-turn-helix transcriptional regulator [Carboxylicivirga sediminis]